MVAVDYLPEAQDEFNQMSYREKSSLIQVAMKLELNGNQLSFPHSSQVKGVSNLRELRPTGGRSRVRAFYRQVGDRFVIAAIGPEANIDPAGFSRVVNAALRRLDAL
ncbi:MAG: type II toxin-antitoxin system RelE/ParE family toxin [Chloroflexi bacterium]|nr:type II toxin-antitoxin system RelE/ParE family toxin [Chloroflexota bacterium]